MNIQSLPYESIAKLTELQEKKYMQSYHKYLLLGGYADAKDLHQILLQKSYAKAFSDAKTTIDEKVYLLYDYVIHNNDGLTSKLIDTIYRELAEQLLPIGAHVTEGKDIQIAGNNYPAQMEKDIISANRIDFFSLVYGLIHEDDVANLQEVFRHLFKHETQFETNFDSVSDFISHMFVTALTEATSDVEKHRRREENANARCPQDAVKPTKQLANLVRYTKDEYAATGKHLHQAIEDVTHKMNFVCDELIENDSNKFFKPTFLENLNPEIRRGYKLNVLNRAYARVFASANAYERAILLETFLGRDSEVARVKDEDIDFFLKQDPTSLSEGEPITSNALTVGIRKYNEGVLYNCIEDAREYLEPLVSSFTSSLTDKEMLELSKVLTMYSHALLSTKYKSKAEFKKAINVMQITRVVNEFMATRLAISSRKKEPSNSSKMGEDE